MSKEREAEKDDKVLSMMLDLCEQQPYLVDLYGYQRMRELLEPMAAQFGTSMPMQTLEALVRAYQERGRG